MKYLLWVFLFFSIVGFSQDAILNDADHPEAELHAAINPLDTNNIVVVVQYGFGSQDAFYTHIYYSKNYGLTWNLSDYHGTADNSQCGDAVLSFDDAGNLYLVDLMIDQTNDTVYTILSKSADGGANWEYLKKVVHNDSDKPWLAIDTFANSSHSGNIYIPVVEEIPMLYTLNNNFQTIDSLPIPDGDHLPSVVVRRDGTVFTSTVALTDSINTVYVQEYSNGGATIYHSTPIVSFPDYTFNAPDISMRFQPTAYLAVDNSGGKYDGRLYLSYTASEEYSPDYFNVFITYSDDGGQYWSTPHIVHNDAQYNIQQFYSSIYVNDAGTVIMDWYDRRNYADSTKMTDFYMGIS